MGAVPPPPVAAVSAPPASLAAGAALVVVGVVLWTLAEYLLHRFDMHGMRGRGTTSREHLEHHAGRVPVPERSPTDWAGAVVLGVALGWWAHPLVGLGWVAGYGLYDLVHWSIHARPPAGRYGRWVRRHHLHHHFADPRSNYGVTSPVWDVVFRSHTRPGVVRVPRRFTMPWLLDAAGRIDARHADDYVVVGAGAVTAATDDGAPHGRDREDAFANRPPSPG